MGSNDSDSSVSGGIVDGPAVVALPLTPSYSAMNASKGRTASGGTNSNKKYAKRGGGNVSGGGSGLMIVGFLLLICLHTVWQANLQLALEDHAKRALRDEASNVYTMFKERQRVPASALRGAKTSNVRDDYFHTAAHKAYHRTEPEANSSADAAERRTFEVYAWNYTSSITTTATDDAGIVQEDKQMIGRIYGQADSVFEFGLGESTYIAHYVGVPRVSGIDSDATVINAIKRDTTTPTSIEDADSAAMNANYRFYFADVGPLTTAAVSGSMPTTKTVEQLHKSAYDYQVVPLLAEPKPFDVYLVDGRFRVGCLLMSFLHASSAAAAAASVLDLEDTKATMRGSPTVLVHDCMHESYHAADHLLDLVEHSGKNLCAYKRKVDTTDAQLYELWSLTYHNIV